MTVFPSTTTGLFAACAANCEWSAAQILDNLQEQGIAPVNPVEQITDAASHGRPSIVHLLLPLSTGPEHVKRQFVSTACMAALRMASMEEICAYYDCCQDGYTYDLVVDSMFNARSLHKFIMTLLFSNAERAKVLATVKFLLRMTKYSINIFRGNCALLCRAIALGADIAYTEFLLGRMAESSARATRDAKSDGFVAVAQLGNLDHVKAIYARFIQGFSLTDHYSLAVVLFQATVSECILEWYYEMCKQDGDALSAINYDNNWELMRDLCKAETTTIAAVRVVLKDHISLAEIPECAEVVMTDALTSGNPAVVRWLYEEYPGIDLEGKNYWALDAITSRGDPSFARWLVSVRPETYRLVDDKAELRPKGLPFDAAASALEVNAEDECVCCCDATSNTALNCDHLFCRECLDTWYQSGKRSCPTCRATIVVGRSIVVATAHSRKRKLCADAADKRSCREKTVS
jgi:hypothetical protein